MLLAAGANCKMVDVIGFSVSQRIRDRVVGVVENEGTDPASQGRLERAVEVLEKHQLPSCSCLVVDPEPLKPSIEKVLGPACTSMIELDNKRLAGRCSLASCRKRTCRRCSVCKAAYYCTKKHEREHKPVHRREEVVWKTAKHMHESTKSRGCRTK